MVSIVKYMCEVLIEQKSHLGFSIFKFNFFFFWSVLLDYRTFQINFCFLAPRARAHWPAVPLSAPSGH